MDQRTNTQLLLNYRTSESLYLHKWAVQRVQKKKTLFQQQLHPSENQTDNLFIVNASTNENFFAKINKCFYFFFFKRNFENL